MISYKLFGVVMCAMVCATLVYGTVVKNCKGKKSGKMQSVEISSCQKAPCILKKNTTAAIDIKFVPESDVEVIKNRVFARLVGIPLPFLGVDGYESCDKVYAADGETQVGCPLKAGTEYVYKNNFDILQVYPTVSPLVHWALQDSGTLENIVCFEIQSRIVNS